MLKNIYFVQRFGRMLSESVLALHRVNKYIFRALFYWRGRELFHKLDLECVVVWKYIMKENGWINTHNIVIDFKVVQISHKR